MNQNDIEGIVVESLFNVKNKLHRLTLYKTKDTYSLETYEDGKLLHTCIFPNVREALKYMRAAKMEADKPLNLREGTLMDDKVAAEYDDAKMEEGFARAEEREYRNRGDY